MMSAKHIETYLARVPFGALITYVVVSIAFITVTAMQLADIAERWNAVAAATDILSRLEGRGPLRPRSADPTDISVVSGSPFVEGATVTVAGAALLQRLAGAVTRVRASILSTQVDLQGPLSKQGFVAATVSCELEQPALQQLLYDLEAGMPFLSVDQLAVQAPTVAAGASNGTGPGKLRVLISVSGQWQGAR
jgi:general secretion pathway protein M